MRTTLLTVDDDRGFRSVLHRLLSRDSDIELIGQAANGEDAVHAARELRPDIVLMDVTMPGVNGFDATRRIKAYRPETKVIILTIHANEQYERAALDHGADAFIGKKYLASDLLPTIQGLMERLTAQAPESAESIVSALVVDNDVRFRRLAAAHLRSRMNLFIEDCASTEEEAFEKVTRLRPDVVAVNSERPGLELMKSLRGRFPDLRIIALTKLVTEGRKRAAVAAGANELVAKSRFDIDLLPVIVSLSRADPRQPPALGPARES